MTFGFSKPVAGPTESDRPNRLEGDLQSDLYDPLASRADKRIARGKVVRHARKAERAARLELVTTVDEAGRAIGVSRNGVIDDVEDFPAELEAIPLPDREVLEERHVQVVEP